MANRIRFGCKCLKCGCEQSDDIQVEGDDWGNIDITERDALLVSWLRDRVLAWYETTEATADQKS